jgi:septum formation inhibitor-activating ATPase MinD
VLVVNPTLPSIKNTRLVVDWFDSVGFAPEKICVVVNKAVTDPRLAKGMPSPEKIQAYLRRPVEGVIPAVEDRVILNAINKGIPVIASDRDTTKAPIKQLLDLSNHLFRILMGEEDTAVVTDDKQTSSMFGSIFKRK